MNPAILAAIVVWAVVFVAVLIGLWLVDLK